MHMCLKDSKSEILTCVIHLRTCPKKETNLLIPGLEFKHSNSLSVLSLVYMEFIAALIAWLVCLGVNAELYKLPLRAVHIEERPRLHVDFSL
jgi:hypothetical protein